MLAAALVVACASPASHPAATAPGGPPAPPETAVTTQRNDAARSGWDRHETALDTSDVSGAAFGRRVSYPVDGKIYAQPLFVPGLRVDGARHNVTIVATEQDSVYAFDADARGAAPAPLWHTSFLKNGATALSSRNDLQCDAIAPTVGITGTPVIDQRSATLYVVAATHEGSRIVSRLHALDIATGAERRPPVAIGGSVVGTGARSRGGRITFDPATSQQRMGLLLLDGTVYAAFASYCDGEHRAPEHGWIFGYRATDLARVVVYNDTPDGSGGGIWESETGITADDRGRLLLVTGNGDFNLDTGGRSVANAVVALRPRGGSLAVDDWFSPFHEACLNRHDQDIGSGGPLLLPGHGEVLAIGKEGRVYVLDESHLGGHRSIPSPCSATGRTDVDDTVQELPARTVGGVWGSETYWRGAAEYVYTAGVGDHLKAWRLQDGKVVTPAASQAPESLGYPGGVPVVSSDGDRSGTAIVWVLESRPAALRAYDAADLGHELYSSERDPGRDRLPGYDNFSVPTVAAGRVLVGAGDRLLVFGSLH